jgi:hypothetical protein
VVKFCILLDKYRVSNTPFLPALGVSPIDMYCSHEHEEEVERKKCNKKCMTYMEEVDRGYFK